jgi:hypothetical protein
MKKLLVSALLIAAAATSASADVKCKLTEGKEVKEYTLTTSVDFPRLPVGISEAKWASLDAPTKTSVCNTRFLMARITNKQIKSEDFDNYQPWAVRFLSSVKPSQSDNEANAFLLAQAEALGGSWALYKPLPAIPRI